MRLVFGILLLFLWFSGFEAVVNEEENGENNKVLMHGDIMMSPRDIFLQNLPDNVRSKMFMKNDGHSRWPGNIVPYKISSKYNDRERKIIKDALKEMGQKTCFSFPEKTDSHRDYVFIEPLNGCYSELGRRGGRQTISLDRNGCVYHASVQHETMHAIGFMHEHQRPDRDKHIEVLMSNIPERDKSNFVKLRSGQYDLRGFKYDLKSIMHYYGYAFGKIQGGIPMKTMVLKGTNTPVGFNKRMSENDIRKINSMGECSNSKPKDRDPDSEDNNTSSSDCQDKNAHGRKSDCPASKHLCNNPLYHDLMTQECPATCNRC